MSTAPCNCCHAAGGPGLDGETRKQQCTSTTVGAQRRGSVATSLSASSRWRSVAAKRGKERPGGCSLASSFFALNPHATCTQHSGVTANLVHNIQSQPKTLLFQTQAAYPCFCDIVIPNMRTFPSIPEVCATVDVCFLCMPACHVLLALLILSALFACAKSVQIAYHALVGEKVKYMKMCCLQGRGKFTVVGKVSCMHVWDLHVPLAVGDKASLGGKVYYMNTLTNYSQDKRPPPVRGGILADDMGLGRSDVT
eukprot:1159725-Pelagomonas_calceolata.AAC.6